MGIIAAIQSAFLLATEAAKGRQGDWKSIAAVAVVGLSVYGILTLFKRAFFPKDNAKKKEKK